MIIIHIDQISALPLFEKSGSPPTPLNARTGELTPPGMTACACENNCCEYVILSPTTLISASHCRLEHVVMR
jgi:hypothetical protein